MRIENLKSSVMRTAGVWNLSFLRDVITTFVVRSTGLLSMLGVSVLTSRALGPHGRGDYFFVMTLSAVIAQFCNLGLQSSNTYYVAGNPSIAGGLTANSLWISVVLGSCASLGVIVFLSLRHDTPGLGYVLFLVPATLFFLLGCNLFIGLEEITRFNYLQVGAYVLLFLLIACSAVLHLKSSGFLFLTSASWLIAASCVLIALLPRISVWRFDRALFLSGMHYSAKAYLASLLGLLILRTNVFVLKYLSGAEAVGHYSIAAQMADAMVALPAVVGMLLFPKLVQDQRNAWKLTRQSLTVVGLSMGVLCILVAAIARPFILFVYGPAFGQSIAVFCGILPGIFFLSLAGIISQYLSARGFPFMQVVIWLSGFVLMAALSYTLIRHYALFGAAVAVSIDYALVFMMLFCLAWYCRKGEKKDEENVTAPLPEVISAVDGLEKELLSHEEDEVSQSRGFR